MARNGHGSPGNSDGGGNGSGGPGASGSGSSGGGTAGGGYGGQTPGSPKAADSKRGSSMGKEGGTAPDSSNPGGRETPGPIDGNNRGRTDNLGVGSQTPGSKANPGRRGAHAEGSTAQSRARDAMSRHRGEAVSRSLSGLVDSVVSMFGDEEGVTVAENAANLKSLDPTLTDKEVAGMVLGDPDASLEGAINAESESGLLGMIGSIGASALGGLPGMFGAAAVNAASRANRARNTISDTNAKSGMTMNDSFSASLGTQAKGAAAGGLVGHMSGGVLGPIGARTAGPVGAMVGQNVASAVSDAAASTAMTGETSPSPSISSNTPGKDSSGGGRTSASVSNARAAMQPRQPSSPKYASPVINRDNYSRGLMSLAQTI